MAQRTCTSALGAPSNPLTIGICSLCPVTRSSRELQEFAERACPSVVHGRAHRHLGGLQIQVPRLTATAKDDTQQLVYFARNFLLDRFRRFFPWIVGEISATGRNSQICSLTSNN